MVSRSLSDLADRRRARQLHIDYYRKHGFHRPPADLRVRGTLREFLASRRPLLIGKPGEPSFTIVAPLNADGQAVPTVPHYKETPHGSQVTSSFSSLDGSSASGSVTDLPASYRLDRDSPMKNLIVTPQSQYTCGCCWAVSTATSTSDAFVVAGYIGRQILLSWADLLACFPNCSAQPQSCSQQVSVGGKSYFPSLQCGGGNFMSAAQWVQNQGIVSSACLCYAWCSSNTACTAGDSQAQPTSLNALIPPCTSCAATGCQVHIQPNLKATTRFYAANVVAESIDPNANSTDILNHENRVQNWILTKGAVTATFVVLQNFIVQGTFVSPKNPSGIYLEYVGNGSRRSSQLSPIIGAHAVSVIGWSLDPIHWSLLFPTQPPPSSGVAVDSQGFIMIPNWVVRNSWGTSWNQGGFFQIACYPYNTTSQLDVPVQINGVGSGGMILLEAGTVDFYPDPLNPDSPQPNDFLNTQIVNVNRNLISPPSTPSPPPVTPSTPPPPISPSNAPPSSDGGQDILAPVPLSDGTTVRPRSGPPAYAVVLLVIGIIVILGGIGFAIVIRQNQSMPIDQPDTMLMPPALPQTLVYGSTGGLPVPPTPLPLWRPWARPRPPPPRYRLPPPRPPRPLH